MNQNAKTTNPYRRMNDTNLLDKVNTLMSTVWQCRQRGWNRKLETACDELRTALAELTRRTGWKKRQIAEALTDRIIEG